MTGRTMDQSGNGIEPLLVDARQCAALCGVSRATWYAWQAGGAIPLPTMRRGRVVRLSRREIEAWIAAACPARDRWQVLKGERR